MAVDSTVSKLLVNCVGFFEMFGDEFIVVVRTIDGYKQKSRGDDCTG